MFFPACQAVGGCLVTLDNKRKSESVTKKQYIPVRMGLIDLTGDSSAGHLRHRKPFVYQKSSPKLWITSEMLSSRCIKRSEGSSLAAVLCSTVVATGRSNEDWLENCVSRFPQISGATSVRLVPIDQERPPASRREV